MNYILSRYYLRLYYSVFSLSLLPSQRYHYPEFSAYNVFFFLIFIFTHYISLNNIEYYFVYFYVVFPRCDKHLQEVLSHFISLNILHILILSSLPDNLISQFLGREDLSFSSIFTFAFLELQFREFYTRTIGVSFFEVTFFQKGSTFYFCEVA